MIINWLLTHKIQSSSWIIPNATAFNRSEIWIHNSSFSYTSFMGTWDPKSQEFQGRKLAEKIHCLWIIFFSSRDVNCSFSCFKCVPGHIVKHEHHRRYKLILEIGLSKGFAPTRLIISIFHRLIGQYFESGILFISLANLHGGKRWLDVWERRRQAPLYSNKSPRWVYSAYFDLSIL